MSDKYPSFEDLKEREKEGRAFRVRVRKRYSDSVVVAPHGGGIEPGTSEIADAIAAADLSLYSFEGLKARRNEDLHITSSTNLAAWLLSACRKQS